MQDTFIHIWRLLNPAVEYATRGRTEACRRLWESFDLQRQRYTYQTIRDKKRRGEFVNPNPYFAIEDNSHIKPQKTFFEPTDWNGRRAPEPTEIACYNGHWGMYTLTDIQLFNLQTKPKQ